MAFFHEPVPIAICRPTGHGNDSRWMAVLVTGTCHHRLTHVPAFAAVQSRRLDRARVGCHDGSAASCGAPVVLRRDARELSAQALTRAVLAAGEDVESLGDQRPDMGGIAARVTVSLARSAGLGDEEALGCGPPWRRGQEEASVSSPPGSGRSSGALPGAPMRGRPRPGRPARVGGCMSALSPREPLRALACQFGRAAGAT